MLKSVKKLLVLLCGNVETHLSGTKSLVGLSRNDACMYGLARDVVGLLSLWITWLPMLVLDMVVWTGMV